MRPRLALMFSRWSALLAAAGLVTPSLWSANTGRAVADPLPLALARDALPGGHRVGSAEPADAPIALSAGAGLGLASGVLGSDHQHLRLLGSLAASVTPLPWLSLGLRIDGRRDQHSGLASTDPNAPDSEGSDDSLVGEPRLLVQARTPLSPDWHLGARLTAWFPGADAPSLVPAATTVDLAAQVSYAPPRSPLRVSAALGYRLDRSAESAEGSDALSAADRLSLGVSEFDAALLGVGASYALGRTALLAEWSWDRLLGDGAPSTGAMRVSGGVRVAVNRDWSAELVVEGLLSDLPTAAPGDPLAPYEPRVTATLGLSARFGRGPAPGPASAASDSTEAEAEAERGAVTGTLRSSAGEPLAEVTIALLGPEGSRSETRTDAEGGFRFEDVAPGPVTLAVDADGYQPVRRALTLRPGTPAEVAFQLQEALPSGQLRGFVRSFRGQPIAASLVVEPLGETFTADADGAFEIDLAPGKYRVIVSAPGFRQQRRAIVVEEGGVVILNVDLRRGR
ncbi:carboxypeptidase regulatory-like domain-containing protein [Haliangium ochraceum]|uniref:PEGA domain protein n=1 Tax=Haliangium ochraceum (strain DSM 14365 / JCM 11303 / SMP-2) TaxID=502025 RepID=D0LRF8_HALO1|nr:carboxypeptidase regulatory-like domain-containing protein [Haliangium ochraceum]ACY17186.1 hypothetical protein Hoch_4695 [Haliangium ochraceum DSM 14365]